MIEAKVIEDTISPDGVRLTTLEAEIHRYVLAELNTHRADSRNSASSRAQPVAKTLARVTDDPAFPAVWASEQKGMVGGPPLDGAELFEAQRMVRDIHEFTTRRVRSYLDQHPIDADDGRRRLHKSLVNRYLEPFMWHRVILTACEFENFWRQRCHPSAMPEMRLAAEAMYAAMQDSTPRELGYGQWHLPYIHPADWHAIYEIVPNTPGVVDPEALELAKKISTARCARVSYLTHDGRRDIREDIRMFDETLMGGTPKHWSPMEHVATPVRLSGARSVSGWEFEVLAQAADAHSLRFIFEPGRGLLVQPEVWEWDSPYAPLARSFEGHHVVPGNFAPGWLQFRHVLGGIG